MPLDLTNLLLGKQLGKGGEGVVYAAALGDTALAVKVIAPTSEAAAAILRERIAAADRGGAESPLCPFLAHGTLGSAPFADQLRGLSRDSLYLVMPLLRAPTLATCLPLDSEAAAGVLLQLCAALGRLPVGVFHGDLRPENIYLRDDGTLTLADQTLTREPSAEEDLRGIAQLVRQLALSSPGLSPGLSTDGVESLPTLKERLQPLCADPAAACRKLATAFARPPVSLPVAARRRRPNTLVGLAVAVVSIFFAPIVKARLPRPDPETVVKTDSPLVTAGHGLYDHTGKVHHRGSVYPLQCGKPVDGSRGFIEITVAEPVDRVHLMSTGNINLWVSPERPPVGTMYCFDVLPGVYQVVQERSLPGEPPVDPKQFVVDVLHPLKMVTTAHLDLSPRPSSEIAPMTLFERVQYWFNRWLDGFVDDE